MPEKFVEDAAWCWWTRPRATRVGDTLHIGALGSGGDILALAVDLPTGATTRTVLATVEDDDHNNPALLVREGMPAISFYSRHDAEEFVRFRVANDEAGTSWGDERSIPFVGETSYAQVHPVGDTLHLFTRSGVTRWAYSSSEDGALTWSAARDFIALDTDQEVYMPTTLLADGRTLRVAIAGHPKEYRERAVHDVFACEVDLVTGDIARPSTGEVVANLFTGEGMPLTGGNLELVFSCPANRTVNLYDIGDGPEFELGFGSKLRDDHSTTDARYHVSTLRDGGWVTDDLGPAGTIFGYIHAGMYLGGLAFPHRSTGGRVVVCREEGGLWHVELRERGDGWGSRPLREPSTTRIVRPWAVTDPGDGPEFLALELERYDDEYLDTLSHLVALRTTDRA